MNKPQDYHQLRVLVINQERQSRQVYPHHFPKSHSLHEFYQQYHGLMANGEHIDKIYHLTGRVNNIRTSGNKLAFIDINQESPQSQSLQVLANARMYTGAFRQDIDLIKRGDIIGIKGYPHRSKSGELSILALELTILAPCLHMIPSKLTDKETRYRQRYLDLIVNRNNINIFKTRSDIINFLRQFLHQLDFTEVETPMMHPIAGGATAKPFRTHYNHLKQYMFMRIAPELYLKMCVISGIDRVYDLGKQFRNESSDMTHNPEYTSLEFYMAYADYNKLMTITENLLADLCQHIHGRRICTVGDHTIDFTPPFRRVNMIPELERLLNVKFHRPLSSEPTRRQFLEIIKQHELEYSGPNTNAKLLDKLVEEFLEKTCINPTFICDHPIMMSPLAKEHRNDNELTERLNYSSMVRNYVMLILN